MVHRSDQAGLGGDHPAVCDIGQRQHRIPWLVVVCRCDGIEGEEGGDSRCICVLGGWPPMGIWCEGVTLRGYVFTTGAAMPSRYSLASTAAVSNLATGPRPWVGVGGGRQRPRPGGGWVEECVHSPACSAIVVAQEWPVWVELQRRERAAGVGRVVSPAFPHVI